MKSWTLADEIRRDSELSAAIDESKPLLEEEIGPSAQFVDARWTLSESDRRRLLVLNLSDWTWPIGVEAQFEFNELRSREQLRRRLRWLWGDLLQARNHQQIRELERTGA